MARLVILLMASIAGLVVFTALASALGDRIGRMIAGGINRVASRWTSKDTVDVERVVAHGFDSYDAGMAVTAMAFQKKSGRGLSRAYYAELDKHESKAAASTRDKRTE